MKFVLYQKNKYIKKKGSDEIKWRRGVDK